MSSLAQAGVPPSRLLRTDFVVDGGAAGVVACGKGGLGSGPGPKKRGRPKWVYPSYAQSREAKAKHRKSEKEMRRHQRLLNLGFHECMICNLIILRRPSDESMREVQCRRPCSAYFHKWCADEWLKGVSSCPQCKIVPMFEGGPTEAPQAAAFRNETMQIWEGDDDSDSEDWTTLKCGMCENEIEVEYLNDAYTEGWMMDDEGNWECAECIEEREQNKIEEKEQEEERYRMLALAVADYLNDANRARLECIQIESPSGLIKKFYTNELKAVVKALQIYKRNAVQPRVTVTDDSGQEYTYTRQFLCDIISNDETDTVREWIDSL